jgi:hypothetical protein
MINRDHPYRLQVIDYVYVLTVIDADTSVKEGFSYHEAEATDDISTVGTESYRKKERFNWYTHFSALIRTPTAEVIAEVRKHY